jgi:hypothetical protein
MPGERGNFFRIGLKEFFGKLIAVEPGWKTVDAVSLGNSANTVVYNPGSDSTERYEVQFNLVNSATANTSYLVQVGVDTAATGALTNHWWRNYVPYRYTSGWQGPYIINGDDDVMGWADTASVVDMMIRAREILSK